MKGTFSGQCPIVPSHDCGMPLTWRKWASHVPSLHCKKEMVLQVFKHGMEKCVSFTWSLWIKLPLFWGKNAKGSLVVWIRSLINTFKNIYIDLHWVTNSFSTFHKNFFSSNFFWKLMHIYIFFCLLCLSRAQRSWCSFNLKKPMHTSKRTRLMGWGIKLGLRNSEGPLFYCGFSPPPSQVLFQHIFFLTFSCFIALSSSFRWVPASLSKCPRQHGSLTVSSSTTLPLWFWTLYREQQPGHLHFFTGKCHFEIVLKP